MPFDDDRDLKKCSKCGITEKETTTLKKCPICFNYFCINCAYNMGGREFCSKECAHYFFFGEEE